MAYIDDLFGQAYLDAENFRARAAAFGVGMSLADYPNTADGNKALTSVLQAASRIIDTETGAEFSDADRTEQHIFDFESRQIKVNNPPVASVSSLELKLSNSIGVTFSVDDIFINRQLNYVEVLSLALTIKVLTPYLGLGLNEPVVEIVYKSSSAIPKPVQLACGYQAAKMINDGFVDKQLPTNFGAIDLGGIKVNNRKGSLTTREEKEMSVLDPTAAKLLAPFKSISIR